MLFLWSSAFWVGMLKIVWVNILLSGDNAVVIALASRALPASQQKKAVVWGSIAAIGMRIALTIFAVQLLGLPWLKAIGAVLLIWIGIQLLTDDGGEDDIEEAGSLLAAVKTILIADLVMSLDNVLAVAGAADAAPPETKLLLLVVGLALSIPIVIFGSSIVLKFMDRFPVIVTLGAMLLGWIAGEMLYKEEVVASSVSSMEYMHYGLPVIGALLVLIIGKVMTRRAAEESLVTEAEGAAEE
ncbi:TerC family protein [Propionivibrio soli]|uniref:TerC family protein n=1 Tax=Propionivibrio soli TaxID=2976531 RepID=UPI0021E9044A|nr:TerC family protein [Propionivibrio soli]